MQKKYKVRITATAQRDIHNIWDYIASDSPKNALDFVDEIEGKIGGLTTLPERNPVIPEAQILQTTEYRHLLYKKYRIVYRCNKETVFVLRIFNGAKLLDIAALES